MRNSMLKIGILMLCFFTFGTVATAQQKARSTKKIKDANCAHARNHSDEGKVKRIKGILTIGLNNEPLDYGGIVALYRMAYGKEIFIISYLTGEDGRFRFKNIEPGTTY